jgi:hypothetical protein
MSNGQSYLVKILDSCSHDLEERLSEEERSRLSALTDKIGKSQTLEDDLKKLYQVKDMEQCALACLWIVGRTSLIAPQGNEFDLDRKLVTSSLLEYFVRRGGVIKGAPLPDRPVPQVFLKFYESFDTLVLQAKDSTDDPDLYEQMFDHLQEFCEEKSREMETIDEPGVQIFMNALIDFLHWVTTRKIRNNDRVVQILGDTTTGLSEVVGSGVDFNISALEQVTTHLSDARYTLK